MQKAVQPQQQRAAAAPASPASSATARPPAASLFPPPRHHAEDDDARDDEDEFTTAERLMQQLQQMVGGTVADGSRAGGVVQLSPAAAAAAARRAAIARAEAAAEGVVEAVKRTPLREWMPPRALWEATEASVPFKAQLRSDGWVAQAHVPGILAKDVCVDVDEEEDGEQVATVAFTRVPTVRDVAQAAPAVLSTLVDAVVAAVAADAAAGRCLHRSGAANAHCPFTPEGLTEGVLHASVLAALKGRYGKVAERVPFPAAADGDRLEACYEGPMVILTAPWRAQRYQQQRQRVAEALRGRQLGDGWYVRGGGGGVIGGLPAMLEECLSGGTPTVYECDGEDLRGPVYRVVGGHRGFW